VTTPKNKGPNIHTVELRVDTGESLKRPTESDLTSNNDYKAIQKTQNEEDAKIE
jgi:hypothetical protein